jgi:hypothetical protein
MDNRISPLDIFMFLARLNVSLTTLQDFRIEEDAKQMCSSQ